MKTTIIYAALILTSLTMVSWKGSNESQGQTPTMSPFQNGETNQVNSNSTSQPSVGSQTHLDGATSGGGGFADENALYFLEKAKAELAADILRMPTDAFKNLPSSWTQAKVSAVFKNLRVNSEQIKFRYNRRLLLNYGVDSKGISYIEVLRDFFTAYDVPVLTLNDREVRSYIDEVKIRLTHEFSHLIGVGLSEDTDYLARIFGLGLLRSINSDFLVCDHDGEFNLLKNGIQNAFFGHVNPDVHIADLEVDYRVLVHVPSGQGVVQAKLKQTGNRKIQLDDGSWIPSSSERWNATNPLEGDVANFSGYSPSFDFTGTMLVPITDRPNPNSVNGFNINRVDLFMTSLVQIMNGKDISGAGAWNWAKFERNGSQLTFKNTDGEPKDKDYYQQATLTTHLSNNKTPGATNSLLVGKMRPSNKGNDYSVGLNCTEIYAPVPSTNIVELKRLFTEITALEVPEGSLNNVGLLDITRSLTSGVNSQYWRQP